MLSVGNCFKHFKIYHNTFYAEGKEIRIKYLYNQGYINTDNPKLAARYFLNAIDRIQPLQEKYQKTIQEHDTNIQMLKQIVAKPFEKRQRTIAIETRRIKT
jgi:hypothetical protein